MDMLSSEIIQKRDQFFNKFDHLALEELSIKIKELLISETEPSSALMAPAKLSCVKTTQ